MLLEIYNFPFSQMHFNMLKQSSAKCQPLHFNVSALYLTKHRS